MTLRTLWRIARWEVAGRGGGLDRRAVVLASVALLALALLVPLAASAGPSADADLYRVGVDADSPYREPLEADERFRVGPPDDAAFAAGRLDLLVRGDEVRIHDSRTGRAAAAALRASVEGFNDRRMREEPDTAAAFPVVVELRYVERDVGVLVDRGGSAGGQSDGNGGGRGADESVDEADGDASNGGLGGFSLGGSALFPRSASGTPSDLSPPFPFASLVLAFAFVVPMNFVVQAFASSVLHDRGNRRGVPLLATPVSRWSIVIGKALPYFLAMVAIAAATAWLVGGGLLSVYAVVPIAMVFLAAALLAGLLARSHKELTFVLVAVSVTVTTYVFVPAIFVDVHPVAAISPLSLVVFDLEGTVVPPATVAFATLPAFLAAGVLFGVGSGLYREETLFTQRPLTAKLLDALATVATSPRRVGLASLLSIPFVFLAELLVVALLFVLPLGLALPALFVAIAVVEEVAKSLPGYAGFARGRYGRSPRTAALVGAWSGLGFFLGEKAAAVAQVVGLFELDLGRVAFELGAGVGGATSPVALGGLLLAPLVLHAATAAMTALGASRNGGWYVASLAVAVTVHVAYNLLVVVAVA